MSYDPQSVSDRFLHLAQRAEQYLTELRFKVKQNDSYKPFVDQTLAEFVVYNYRHGRPFLETRDGLVQALQELKSYPYASPYGVFSADRFEQFRQNLINHLLKEFTVAD